jgi:prephenate dehydrogenase
MGTILDLQDGQEELFRFSAGGLRDFTRIAASHPIMWRDILLCNREEVLVALARFRQALTRIEEMIRGQDPVGLVEEFQRAREVREQLQ